MPSVNVVMSCGHPERRQVKGSGSNKAAQMRNMARHPCRECREEEARKAALMAERQGLPVMEGPPRQAAAAEVVRRELLHRMDPENGENPDLGPDWTPERAQRARRNVMAVTDSGWWLEHRADGAEQLHWFGEEMLVR